MKIALVNEACPYMDVKDTTPKEIFPSFCPVMHEGGESRVPLTFFSSICLLKNCTYYLIAERGGSLQMIF